MKTGLESRDRIPSHEILIRDQPPCPHPNLLPRYSDTYGDMVLVVSLELDYVKCLVAGWFTCIAHRMLATQQPRVRHHHNHVRQRLLAAFRRHAPGVSDTALQVLAEKGHRVQPELAKAREGGERLEVVQERS